MEFLEVIFFLFILFIFFRYFYPLLALPLVLFMTPIWFLFDRNTLKIMWEDWFNLWGDK